MPRKRPPSPLSGGSSRFFAAAAYSHWLASLPELWFCRSGSPFWPGQNEGNSLSGSLLHPAVVPACPWMSSNSATRPWTISTEKASTYAGSCMLLNHPGWCFGGPDRDRTGDLFHAMEARSQLRHRPTFGKDFSYSHGYGALSQSSLQSPCRSAVGRPHPCRARDRSVVLCAFARIYF